MVDNSPTQSIQWLINTRQRTCHHSFRWYGKVLIRDLAGRSEVWHWYCTGRPQSGQLQGRWHRYAVHLWDMRQSGAPLWRRGTLVHGGAITELWVLVWLYIIMHISASSNRWVAFVFLSPRWICQTVIHTCEDASSRIFADDIPATFSATFRQLLFQTALYTPIRKTPYLSRFFVCWCMQKSAKRRLRTRRSGVRIPQGAPAKNP